MNHNYFGALAKGGVSRKFLLPLMLCLMLAPAGAQNVPSATADDSETAPPQKPVDNKAARESASETDTPEAANFSQIVKKHRHKRKKSVENLHAQVKSLLAAPPSDAAERSKWRKKLQETIRAEQAATEQADEALNKELDVAGGKLRPKAAQQE